MIRRIDYINNYGVFSSFHWTDIVKYFRNRIKIKLIWKQILKMPLIK